jgi:hypothetical protein
MISAPLCVDHLYLLYIDISRFGYPFNNLLMAFCFYLFVILELL